MPKRVTGVPAKAPTRQDILDFIRTSPTPVGKREIARAFAVKGADRAHLKALLRDIESEGDVERGRGRRFGRPGSLPEVAIVDLIEVDTDGELIARPHVWRGEGEPPRIYMANDGRPALAPGMRVLARLGRIDATSYAGRLIRILAEQPARFMAVHEIVAGRARLRPTDRRHKDNFLVVGPDPSGPGDLVLAEPVAGRALGLRQARIVERIGAADDPASVSLIAIHSYGIPHRFAPEALAMAAAAAPATLGQREDLRSVPLVTIDGPDARDFDDAVWAEADDDPGNANGWHLLVAIADVAWYARPGDALDRGARERGNSVYFPDRVVPMLPEALSNGLCSLKPKEDRACLAVHLWLDADGRILRHRFVRGLMRSAARLTYGQVQDAIDGRPDDPTGPLVDPVIRPLYGAYRSLAADRRLRGTLEIDLPERQVILAPDGRVRAVLPRQRHDSHRLIEEFMIAANVAAAETLEARSGPCLYRIHDKPDAAKVEALRQFLGELGLAVAAGQLQRPGHFTALLARAADGPLAFLINDLVLRSQAQAVYSHENIGHFGLGLGRYAHFTSPIRRYADLLVHRALISVLGLGDGGLPADGAQLVAQAGEHLSTTERRADAASRDSLDRYASQFLADRVGETFPGRIAGVTRFGLFIRLNDLGIDGLVPIGSLPRDYYDHDPGRHALVGRRAGGSYRLGDLVEVRLTAADPITGSLVMAMIGEGTTAANPRPRPTNRRRHPRR
ncbi:MAG: ribonuclease R [Alphaproteobacteria bacterium]|nr:ribonuclease R [Alphaproteobacteria bacterium]